MPTAATHYTYKEQEILAHHAKRAMLRYKDDNAFYCSACETVLNVTCPKCKAGPETQHGEPPLFRRITTELQRWDGYSWVDIECGKCDFMFKVIYR